MRDAMAETLRPGLQRPFGLLLVRPLWPGLVLALVTVLALWQATNLRIAVDLSGLIGPQTDGALALRDYEVRFAPFRAEEVLLVTAPDFGTDEALQALESLVLDLQFVEGVEQVISLASVPAPGREGAWLSGPELADLQPADRLATMRAQNPLAAQLMSADRTAAAVIVVPQAGQGGDALAAALAETTGASPLRVRNVGLAAVQRAIGAELIRDLAVLTPAAVGLCLILSLILFRSARAVIVIALPPITGLIWFFGWLGWAGIGVDPVMGSLPVVLIVLAFSDSIHVYHAATHAVSEGGERRALLARALAQTAPAAALTSLTTVIAFSSLAIPDSPSLNAMALTGGVGMALCLASVLLLSPLLMVALGAPRLRAQPVRPFARLIAPAHRVARFPRAVALGAVLVLAGAWALQSQSSIGFRYADYLPRGAEVTDALAQMEAAGLGSDRMLVIVQGDSADPLARVRQTARVLWGDAGSAWTEGETGAAMLARMASHDGTAHALPVQLAIATHDVRADAALAQLRGQIDAAGLTDQTRVIGAGHALLTEGPKLVESLRFGLYTTIIAITLLVALVHRSWRLALIALVVNLIPILGVEAWLVLAGRDLTIMNMIALTVAFGIAVDDTLHFLNRFRLAPGPDIGARVDRALIEAGPPMAATTAILLAGLVVTLFSALPGLAVYGGLIALAVALALLADLFLLPGLIRWSLR